ncbi:unnamed protein product [Allacma fusca]|uniref:Uncharacterized protein n=1 Tax=Allacma fusca TaxID=39272 RepID=A0A8J2JHX5_9HEXA|nr:unnamed protein product [Allacma fusca]
MFATTTVPATLLKTTVQEICFAAALECKRRTLPNGTDEETCGCLELSQGLVCEDDVCQKASAVLNHECSWSPTSWKFYLIALTLLTSFKTTSKFQLPSSTQQNTDSKCQ